MGEGQRHDVGFTDVERSPAMIAGISVAPPVERLISAVKPCLARKTLILCVIDLGRFGCERLRPEDAYGDQILRGGGRCCNGRTGAGEKLKRATA